MRQRLLSHRGCWKHGLPKNSIAAMKRSFAYGYGVETDIRDEAGQLVISHDLPVPTCPTLRQVMDAAAIESPLAPPTLALNIKADGLADLVRSELARQPQLQCFVFDMAVPDMLHYFNAGIPTFTRLSEVEPVPAWLERCRGVWLDAFTAEWYGMGVIRDLLAKDKYVCVVSPELHGREYIPLWQQLKTMWADTRLMLCTDLPDDALHFFDLGHD
jgi:hypothetical protein